MSAYQVGLVKKFKDGYKPLAPRDSSTILLFRLNQQTKIQEVCMVTKTKKIDWAGNTVFPGGLTSLDADGKLVNYVQKHYSKFCNYYHFTFDDLLYRITGIRELFEETGILLIRKIDTISSLKLKYPIYSRLIDTKISTNDLLNWRKNVLKDAFEFEKLLRSINAVPDILSLVPWARMYVV